MTPERLWGLCELYERHLDSLVYPAREMIQAEYDASQPPPGVLLSHCRWMMQHCLGTFRTAWRNGKVPETKADAFYKAMRWMCYVQGVLNTLGVFSCTTLREQTRGEPVKTQMLHPPRALSPEELAVRSCFTAPVQSRLVEADFASAGELRAPMSAMSMDHLNRPPEIVPSVPYLTDEQLDRARLDRPPEPPPETEDERYARLEKEHLGDPDLKTGIYAEKAVADVTEAAAQADAGQLTSHARVFGSLRWSSENPPTANINREKTDDPGQDPGRPPGPAPS